MALQLDLIWETQNKWVWEGSLEVSGSTTTKNMANQVFCTNSKERGIGAHLSHWVPSVWSEIWRFF